MTIRTNPLLQDAAESFFLAKLFVELNDQNIRYAVMRNHGPLPYIAGGSDLDIIVSLQDEIKTKALIHAIIKNAGGVALGTSETVGSFKVYAVGRNPESSGSWWGQRIDINVGLFFKGQKQLADRQPWPVHSYRSIVVLEDGFAGLLGVLKEVFNNGTFPERYASSARQAVEQEWASVKSLLAPMGETALEQLKALILSYASTDAKSSRCREIRNGFLRHAFTTHPAMFFRSMLACELSKVHRYFKPSGKVIAILGVDGAGKSTIINAIKPVLDEATHNATVVKHLRPSWLPPLARLKGKGAASSGPVLDPHSSTPSGALGSLFRLMYLTLDYILGYWLKIRPNIAKQPTVVIFDRYAYDMALDPSRFRINLPASIIRWFIRLAPKPDMIFCLHGSPEILAARKQELPAEEVRRQVDALKAFAEDEPRAILISTEGTVEESRDQVLQAICAYCENSAGK